MLRNEGGTSTERKICFLNLRAAVVTDRIRWEQRDNQRRRRDNRSASLRQCVHGAFTEPLGHGQRNVRARRAKECRARWRYARLFIRRLLDYGIASVYPHTLLEGIAHAQSLARLPFDGADATSSAETSVTPAQSMYAFVSCVSCTASDGKDGSSGAMWYTSLEIGSMLMVKRKAESFGETRHAVGIFLSETDPSQTARIRGYSHTSFPQTTTTMASKNTVHQISPVDKDGIVRCYQHNEPAIYQVSNTPQNPGRSVSFPSAGYRLT